MLSVVFNEVGEGLQFGFGWVVLFPDRDELSPYVRASSWVSGSAHAIFVCWLGYWRQASFPFYYFMCSRRSPTSIFRPRGFIKTMLEIWKKNSVKSSVKIFVLRQTKLKKKILAPYIITCIKFVSCRFTLFSFRYCWADTFVFLDEKKVTSSGKYIYIVKKF